MKYDLQSVPSFFRKIISTLACLVVLLTATLCLAQPSNSKKNRQAHAHPATHPVVFKISDSRLAPLTPSEGPVTFHAPFDSGDCGICHLSNNQQNPGGLKASVNELCMNCHDDFNQTLARKYKHPPSQKNCTACHNPHNSKYPHLLLEETGKLCLSCHQQIKQTEEKALVKHGALTQGDKCVNCHNPHGANVEHLLVQLPMQLCLNCHGKDNVVDHNGKKLTNMKTLLADNPNHHGPVASEDCGSCHQTHGSDNFRLLTNAYPPMFYSAWDSKNYALCFGCHDEKAFTTPETEELTQFRDGKRNLHYLHTNKGEMGRTCRACHEVHASTQPHQIRDAVPYGPKGWMLKINFTPTATGGSCSRTCHSTKTYNNTRPQTPAKPAPVATQATPAAGAKQ